MRWLVLILWTVTVRAADPLAATFGDGKAEVSSYRVTQPRYGEPRPAWSVLIFVPEDLHRDTRIKVEDYAKTPPKDRLPVLKLNRVVHFNTGIYDYAAMTSVFSSLEAGAGLTPAKISITVSEWCGNFYEQLLPDAGGARRQMHSYFEAEGDRADYLKAPAGALYEDALPILIRELRGTWLEPGSSRAVSVLPSLWSSRLTHDPLKWEDAVIERGTGTEAGRWTWKIGSRKVTYWVDKDYPHYLLKWESSTGEKGERLKTLHVPYWKHHGNLDAKLRQQLELPGDPR